MRYAASGVVAAALLLSIALHADDNIDADAAIFSIERNQTMLIISGDTSSAGHEQVLLQTASRLFPDTRLETKLETRFGLPSSWSLITDLTLQALSHTQSSSAEITPHGIELRGFTTDAAAWSAAIDRLEKRLPVDMPLHSLVHPVSARQSFSSMCRQLFAAALHSHRIEFAKGSNTLSSSAHGLLDELAELGMDCPSAAISITGSGDGGPTSQQAGRQRAEAVAAYLRERGIDQARLQTFGSETSDNRRIVFAVSF